MNLVLEVLNDVIHCTTRRPTSPRSYTFTNPAYDAMPVEPVSGTMLGLIGIMVILNLIIFLEPKYDQWQERRRRTRTDQAELRIGTTSFRNFIKIAGLLNGVVVGRNRDMLLLFSRIRTLTVVYQNYPELLVPTSDYFIPHVYSVNRVNKKVHIQTETDILGNVVAFNIIAMTNQTNEELFAFVTQLQDVPLIVV